MTATLTIDLTALRKNWRLLAAKVAPVECAAVVKANAYGIGLEPALRALAAEGAGTFFVARLDEGIRARAILPDATIYVLDGLGGTTDAFVAHRLRPVLNSHDEIERWLQGGAHAPAALQVDTGMNRLGVPLSDVVVLKPLLTQAHIALVLSHFTSSETVAATDNAKQIARFQGIVSLAPRASLANSSGVFLAGAPFFDLVRPGYALYGGNPTPEGVNPMHAVVALTAPVLQVRAIATGDAVGYNNGWTARRPSRIATIGLGYADGIPRGAAGTNDKPGPDVVVAGTRCPIVGRISMDLITVDVTDVDTGAVVPGAAVEILGPTISVDEFGSRAGTIGYEILTGLGSRYRRVYTGG